VRAEKEYNLELKLNTQILEKLKLAKADIEPNPKQPGTFLIQGVDELQQLFDEQFNILIMMKQNPYVAPIKKKVEEQERKLIGFQDLLDGWVKIQRGWIYLEPIFSSEDLKKSLPHEKKMFDEVDKVWRQVMQSVNEEMYIYENMEWEKVKADFDSCNRKLDEIQKSLSNYLGNHLS